MRHICNNTDGGYIVATNLGIESNSGEYYLDIVKFKMEH